jgi:plastocyanin
MTVRNGFSVLMLVLLTLLFSANTASAKPKPSPKTYTVSIKGFKFVPEKLEVNRGDTVIWKNEDIVPHLVATSEFKSKSMDQGESWTYQAKQKGDFPYICKFHPTMKAELIVH